MGQQFIFTNEVEEYAKPLGSYFFLMVYNKNTDSVTALGYKWL